MENFILRNVSYEDKENCLGVIRTRTSKGFASIQIKHRDSVILHVTNDIIDASPSGSIYAGDEYEEIMRSLIEILEKAVNNSCALPTQKGE